MFEFNFKNTYIKELYKIAVVSFVFFGFLYANVAYDFSTVFRRSFGDSALALEYQKSLIQNHVNEKSRLEARAKLRMEPPVERPYLEQVSDGIIIFFAYFFSFLHAGSEEFALGEWNDDLYAASAYSAFDLMSLNVYTNLEDFFDGE